MHHFGLVSAYYNINEPCWLNALPSTTAAGANQIKASLTVGECVNFSSTIAIESDEVLVDHGLIENIDCSTMTVIVLSCLAREIMQESNIGEMQSSFLSTHKEACVSRMVAKMKANSMKNIYFIFDHAEFQSRNFSMLHNSKHALFLLHRENECKVFVLHDILSFPEKREGYYQNSAALCSKMLWNDSVNMNQITLKLLSSNSKKLDRERE